MVKDERPHTVLRVTVAQREAAAAGTRLDKGFAWTGQQEGFDKSGGINGPTKEVLTDGDDNQKDDN
jgi:hypothetical protein